MAVGVDQAGDQGAAAAVEQEARPLRPPVAALEQLPDPAVVADPDRVEPEQPPVLAQRIAVDILDQDVGQRRRRQQQGGEEQQDSLQGSSLRIRDEVSCRPAPIAWRSA